MGAPENQPPPVPESSCAEQHHKGQKYKKTVESIHLCGCRLLRSHEGGGAFTWLASQYVERKRKRAQMLFEIATRSAPPC